MHITVGTRLPAPATALGRALLADTTPALSDVRSQGYALVDEELESGVRSLAVPVRDRTGRAVAALSVTTHAARRTLDDCVQTLLPRPPLDGRPDPDRPPHRLPLHPRPPT